MIKNVIKILSLVLCVLLRVHLSLFTVGNIINPVTLMYFLYYSHPFSNWEIGWFPYLFIFTFNSIISYYLLRLIFKDVNLRKYLIAYTICVFMILIYYCVEQRFEMYVNHIYNMDISQMYYEVYGYKQVFYNIVGYTILQTVLLLLYFFVTLSKFFGER